MSAHEHDIQCNEQIDGFKRSTGERRTIDTLPPDHQASDAEEYEHAPNDSLPLPCSMLHLWVGLVERQVVH